MKQDITFESMKLGEKNKKKIYIMKIIVYIKKYCRNISDKQKKQDGVIDLSLKEKLHGNKHFISVTMWALFPI